MQPERQFNIDLLRILATLGVVCIHISSWFLYHKYISDQGGLFFLQLWRSLAFSGFRLFLMVTGYFLITIEWEKNVAQVRSKILRLIIPIIFWSIVYGVVFVFDYVKYSGSTFQAAIQLYVSNIAHGQPYGHLWYIYILPFVLFTIPVLGLIKGKLTRKQFLLLGVLLLIYRILHQVWNESTGAITLFPLRTFDYLGYIILGSALGSFFSNFTPNKKSQTISVATLVIIAAMYLLLSYIESFLSIQIRYVDEVFKSVYILTLFVLFLNLRIPQTKFIRNMSQLGMGIYLIHPLIISLLPIIVPLRLFFAFPLALTVPTMTFVVYGLSALIAAVINRIPTIKPLINIS